MKRTEVQRWRPTKGDINKIKMETSPSGKYVRYADHLAAMQAAERYADDLRLAGALMANTMFNLKQRDTIEADLRSKFEEMQRRWDRAIAGEKP